MIDENEQQSILREPSYERQAARIAGLVEESIADDTFTLTDVLLLQEPFRTLIWMKCDDVTLEGGVPRYGISRAIPGPAEGVLLVHVDPPGTVDSDGRATGDIQLPALKPVLMPGMHRPTMQETMESFGNFAFVPDEFPDRKARNILHRHCWPARQVRNQGGMSGSIVEWRWLSREAQRRSGAAAGVADLYNAILKREGFEAFLTARNVAPPPAAKAHQAQRGGRAAV